MPRDVKKDWIRCPSDRVVLRSAVDDLVVADEAMGASTVVDDLDESSLGRLLLCRRPPPRRLNGRHWSVVGLAAADRSATDREALFFSILLLPLWHTVHERCKRQQADNMLL